MEQYKSRICAFVPARAGSIGVPGKNRRSLAGLPLSMWSVKFALENQIIKHIYFSTDDEELAVNVAPDSFSLDQFRLMPEDAVFEISKKISIHRRSKSQAQTLSLISEVLFDFVNQNLIYEKFDYLLLLQPTSPFRKQDELTRMLNTPPYDTWSSIVSMKDVGGMHPDRMYRVKSGVATPFLSQENGDNKPRQLLEPLLIKDGAFYLLKTENLKNKIMLGDSVVPFVREGLSTINIDTPEDFSLAEYYANEFFKNC